MLSKEQIDDAGKMQEEYEKLFRENKVTRKSLNELCYPFAVKYQIPLGKSIEIAKCELTIWQIEKLLNKKKKR